MEKITITDSLHNELVKTFDARAINLNLKGNKLIEAQTEFFAGAIRAIDILNEATEASCITPRLYFTLLRGDRIRQIPPIPKEIPPM